MDMKNINVPDFNNDLRNTDYYVFAEMLKAGYHSFLIYDPLHGRAYCKDFVVNQNMRDQIFPEFPSKDMKN